MPKASREKHPDVYYLTNSGKRAACIKFLDRVLNTETGGYELKWFKKSINSLGFLNKREALPWMQERSRMTQEWKANPVSLSRAEVRREERKESSITGEALSMFLEEFEADRRTRDPKKRVKLTKDVEYKLTYFADFLNGEGNLWELAANFNEDALVEFRSWLLRRKKRRYKKGVGYIESDEPLSPQSLQNIRQSVLQFCYWLRKHRFISVPRDDMNDAFRNFHKPTSSPQRLSPEELRQVVRAAVELDLDRNKASRDDRSGYDSDGNYGEARFAPFADQILLLMLTGMRGGEALSLQWESIDLERKIIRIASTKTGRERELGFRDSPALHRLLIGLRLQRGESRFVLAGHEPQIARNFSNRQMARLREASGVKRLSRKILRSTFESSLAMAKNDWDPWALARAMGHSVDVASRFYVKGGEPIRGKSFEEWLGIEREVDAALSSLFGGKAKEGAKATA